MYELFDDYNNHQCVIWTIKEGKLVCGHTNWCLTGHHGANKHRWDVMGSDRLSSNRWSVPLLQYLWERANSGFCSHNGYFMPAMEIILPCVGMPHDTCFFYSSVMMWSAWSGSIWDTNMNNDRSKKTEEQTEPICSKPRESNVGMRLNMVHIYSWRLVWLPKRASQAREKLTACKKKKQ